MSKILNPNDCGETLDFKTKAHSSHTCMEPMFHNIKFADERAKHRCACGVAWTHDKKIAGNKWSQEIDLTPTINEQRDKKKDSNPN